MRRNHAVLGIDPGARSGWALLLDGQLVASGEATKTHVHEAVEQARIYCDDERAHLVVVGERWAGRMRRDRGSVRTVSGLGAAWGRWEGALLAAGVPKRRIIRVATQRWRADVIGGRCARRTSEWKRVAREWCARTFGGFGGDYGDDEADALCIAWWGSRSPKVEALRPKARTR